MSYLYIANIHNHYLLDNHSWCIHTGDIQNPVLASRVPGYCTPQKPVAPAFTDVKKPENQDASGNYGYAIAAKMFV